MSSLLGFTAAPPLVSEGPCLTGVESVRSSRVDGCLKEAWKEDIVNLLPIHAAALRSIWISKIGFSADADLVPKSMKERLGMGTPL
jgi:hypothetical protein